MKTDTTLSNKESARILKISDNYSVKITHKSFKQPKCLSILYSLYLLQCEAANGHTEQLLVNIAFNKYWDSILSPVTYSTLVCLENRQFHESYSV